MAFTSGIVTGLLGYSLKKEMLGDSIFYRETSTFTYEIYSVYLQLSPLIIQSGIYTEFRNRYSGDINVKVFNQPGDYLFPNDSIRASKFNVEVQVKSVPNLLSTWVPELLSTSGYRGLDETFFVGSGKNLLDFKENFDFQISENGVQTFNHGVSFGLLTGSRQMASSLAASVFARDKDNSFGISVMVGDISTIANSGTYQNYYTETYDTIRGIYSFNRKRDVLPSGASTYVYNTTHSLDLKEDGIIEISEKGNVKGKLSFAQSQQGADTLISTAYNRCNRFYTIYAPLSTNLSSSNITIGLVNTPIKITRAHNRPAISTDYEITYTNNPLYKNDGTMVQETIDVSDLDIGIVDVKHTIEFNINKRNSTTNLSNLINTAVTDSPPKISGYFTPDIWPLKHIKKQITWPNRKPKAAKVIMEYSNHPKYFVTINGVGYRVLDYKVSRTEPSDIISEYKIINRPTKLSVINYAYQTEKGDLTVSIEAGVGRKSDEFADGIGIRTDLQPYITNLYNLAVSLFFNDFIGEIPLSFTYYLKDIKYNYNSDTGIIQMTVIFSYSIKKYTI